MKTNFLVIATLALVAAGCSKNDDTPKQDNFPADKVIRVTIKVDAMTRAGMTDASLMEFVLFIDNATDAKYSYSACMKKSGASFASYKNDRITPLTMQWKDRTTPVKVVAYAPCYIDLYDMNTVLDGGVAQDQSRIEGVEKSDYVHFCNPVFNPATDLNENGAIPIMLKHMNTKLIVTVTLGTEFNAAVGGSSVNPISSVAVEGTNTYCKFSLADGTVTPTGSKIDNVTMYHESYTAGAGVTLGAKAVYECILVPQTVSNGNFKVSMMIGGVKYTYALPGAVTLDQNTKYTLALTVGKDQVTAGEMTYTAWTENYGGNYTTD
jgi:Fimbrillin-like